MKTKSNPLLIALLFCSLHPLIAQEVNPAGDLSLGLYLTYLHDSKDVLFEGPIGLNNTKQMVRIDNGAAIFPGIGLKRETVNHSYHEIALLGLSFQSSNEQYTIQDASSSVVEVVQGRDKNSFSLFMRLETGRNFAVDKKVVPGIAVGVEPSIFHNQLTPATSAMFPLNIWSVGANFMIIPKLSIRLNEQLSLFGKVPFGLASFSWDRVKMENPSLAPAAQVISVTTFEIGLSRLQFNLGLGVDI